MKIDCFTIYDRKTLTYYPPFYAATSGGATREFGNLVNDPNNMVGKHPNDYVLFRIGTYDDQKALMEPCVPEHIVDGQALLVLAQNKDLFNDPK